MSQMSFWSPLTLPMLCIGSLPLPQGERETKGTDLLNPLPLREREGPVKREGEGFFFTESEPAGAGYRGLARARNQGGNHERK